RILAGKLLVAGAHRLHDRMLARDFGGLRVVTDEAHHRRMILHPRILSRRAGDLIDEALLHAVVVLAGHRADAALEQAGCREGAWKVAGREAADDARERVDRTWVERMRHGCDALVLELLHGLGDLHAEFDPAHALVTFLDAGRLALNLDLEPDAADAGRLHVEIAGLAGNAGIGLVAADHRVERSVPTQLFVDDDIDMDVALGLEPRRLEILDREDVARDAPLHVARSAPVDAAVLDRGRPGIVAPAFAVADRDDVRMPVEQQGAPAARAFPGGDDVGPALVAHGHGNVAGVLLQLVPLGLPHVDGETNVAQVFGEISL